MRRVLFPLSLSLSVMAVAGCQGPDAAIDICQESGDVFEHVTEAADVDEGSATVEVGDYYEDEDGDGLGSGRSEECPIWEDYAQNDDDPCPEQAEVTPSTFYADSDSDGYGDPAVTEEACEASQGYVDNGDDECPEVDGPTPTTWYDDTDGDTFGDPDVTEDACEQPDGFVADATDECPTVDGATPATWYDDSVDLDGLGDPDTTRDACEQPDDYVDNADDLCPDEADEDGNGCLIPTVCDGLAGSVGATVSGSGDATWTNSAGDVTDMTETLVDGLMWTLTESGTLTLGEGTFDFCIEAKTGTLDVVVEGAGMGSTTWAATCARAFTQKTGGDSFIADLTLSGTKAGAANVSTGLFALTNVEIIGGAEASALNGAMEADGVYVHSSSTRGLLYVGPGSLTVDSSCFEDNVTTTSPLYCQTTDGSTSLAVANSEFLGNENTVGKGGAIQNQGCIVEIEDSVFEDNASATFGGAIWSACRNYSSVALDGVSFVGNEGSGDTSGTLHFESTAENAGCSGGTFIAATLTCADVEGSDNLPQNAPFPDSGNDIRECEGLAD